MVGAASSRDLLGRHIGSRLEAAPTKLIRKSQLLSKFTKRIPKEL